MDMRRPISISMIVVVGLLWFPATLQAGKGLFPVTATDALGHRITISRQPQRIVSLAPNVTEILFALGLGKRVVGVTDQCNYPPAAQDKPKVGGYALTSVEKVISLKPDLVIAARGVPLAALRGLGSAGIPLYTIDPRTSDQVLSTIKAIGKLTGRRAAADNLLGRLKARINRVKRRVAQVPKSQWPRVYFQVWDQPLITGGKDSFVGDLIELAGGKNIAHDVRRYGVFSREALVARNPQVVILASMGKGGYRAEIEKFARQPGYQVISAVKNHRVYVIHEDLINRPGPRLVDALEQMAQAIHPQAFR